MRTHPSRIASALFLVTLLLSSLSHAEMIHWNTKSVPNFEEIRDAAYGNDTYVAVGDNNTVLYSADGTNWNNGNLPPGLGCDLNAVEFAFGQFFAGGKKSDATGLVLLISIDGVNWDEISDGFERDAAFQPKEILSLRFGRSGPTPLLLAVYRGTMSEPIIRATIDGVNWTPSSNWSYGSLPFSDGSAIYVLTSGGFNWARIDWKYNWLWTNVVGFPRDLRHFARGNGVYVGVGPGRKLAYSATANSFTSVASPVIADFTGVAFGRDLFVAVGTVGAVVVSYDRGRSWRRASVSGLQSVSLNGVRYVGGRFITYGGGRIITGQPINKRDWSTASLPSGAKPVTSLASDGMTIVAVGIGGQILYSTTGASWSKAAPVTSRDLYRVVYDARTKAFYATGASGTLLRSTNGRSWQTIKTPGSGYYDGVARAGKTLIAFGGTQGQFLQSSDGKRWTIGRETSLKFFGSIVGDGSTAYVFGPSGNLLIKRGNSKNWSISKGASVSLNDLTIANKTIFATGANGRLFSTSQSRPRTWKSLDTRTSGALNGIAPNAEAAKQVAAVGQYGLVYSEPSRGIWRLEMLGSGAPVLDAIIKFKNRWVVAGGLGSSAFISHTQQN